jgi:preprotein translocase subunit SecA
MDVEIWRFKGAFALTDIDTPFIHKKSFYKGCFKIMVLGLASRLFGSSNDRLVKKLSKSVPAVNALEEKYAALGDEEIKAQTNVLRGRLTSGESLDDIQADAFAIVREAAKRTLGQRHYDVQLVGGVTLHQGMIAEMRTGEGKTLVATLAAYLNAIEGKGVHIVTVNDYLAERDSEWMGQIYRFLDLSVGCIKANMTDDERRAAYACDITYGTNNEFGFDYLRDNMKFRLEQLVQRPFNFAIVDEVDSILIDEARTPLIISGPAETSSELYVEIDAVIPHLKDEDYELDEKTKTVTLEDSGVERAEEILKEKGILKEGSLFDAQNISLVHHVNQALRAHKLFKRDTDYIVKDNAVVIIDEFTGRMMEGRRYSEGLHQALEAKERVKIQNENQTLASITFQNYFRLYPKLSGMTGTAMTEATEFEDIYGLRVVDIPTNKDISRVDHNDQIYKDFNDKFNAIVELIDECAARKQPVLVGTTSIEKSEILSAALKKRKIKHNILNARHHEQEAQIIAQAGTPSAVTIATNMAGRGTDIQLGGNLDMRVEQEVDPLWPDDKKEKAIEKIKGEIADAAEIVKQAGGLYVIGTERHESRRIDNQLRGRSGRQGDPGQTIFFLSLDDDLMRIFGAEKLEPLLAHRKIGLKDGEALAHPLISKTLQRAQIKVEQQNYEIRKNLLKFDNVMNDQRKVIYEQRRDIMGSEDVSDLVLEMRYDVVADIVERNMPPGSFVDQWDTQTMESEAKRLLGIDAPITEWSKQEGVGEEDIESRLRDMADKFMALKSADSSAAVMRRVEKAILLQQLDTQWKDHLQTLDHLRQGINLRAFGQRDPLNEYKAEAFSYFQDMMDRLREGVTQTLSLVTIDEEKGALGLMPRANFDNIQTNEDAIDQQTAPQQKSPMASITPIRKEFDQNDPTTWGKTPRNALCPCGSGKKYKHCHGLLVAQG